MIIRDEFIEYTKKTGGLSGAFSESSQIIFSRYFQSDKPIRNIIGRYMIPGCLYIFDYDNKNIDSYNSRPLFLSCGNYKNGISLIEFGIDFSYVPPFNRPEILFKIFSFFEKDIDNNILIWDEGRINPIPINLTRGNLVKIFQNEKLLNYVTRGFNQNSIKNMKLIGYHDWKYAILSDLSSFTDESRLNIYDKFNKLK
jgi:hypothetical protein